MATGISINLEACRFCLKMSENMTQINYNIKMNFQEIMNEELVDNSKLPQKFCNKCSDQFTKFLNFKNSIAFNQQQLLSALQNEIKREKSNIQFIKTEPEDQFDDFEFNSYFDDYSQMVDTSIKEEYQPVEVHTPPKKPRAKKKVVCKPRIVVRKIKKPKIKQIKIINDYSTGDITKTGDWYYCDVCGFETKIKKKLRRHMPRHSVKERPEVIYTCDICGLDIRYKKFLHRHIEKFHLTKEKKERIAKSKAIQCEVCNKMIRRYYYAKHMKVVHEKPVEKMCEHCGKGFACSIQYTHHVRSQHTGERPFKCDYCERTFYNRSLCSTHMYIKHTSKDEVCSICSKVFKNRSYLRNHIRHVHEEPKFMCQICGMKFANKYKLERHQTKHSEMRKYSCKICDATFKIRTGLLTHMRAKHLKTTFTCEVAGCSSTYNRKDHLRVHIRSQHKLLTEEETQILLTRLREIPAASLKGWLDDDVEIEENKHVAEIPFGALH